jgi:serine/threonine protein kinase
LTNYGTRDFKAPELCKGEQGLLKPTDIWSLGMTLLELIFEGLPELKVDIQTNLREKEKAILYKYRQHITKKLNTALSNGVVLDSLATIIKRCLTLDQVSRANAQELVTLVDTHR